MIMMNDIDIWLERLSSLYKSQMRHAATLEGVQVVHLEILRYLSISNKYSNTAQALTEYLGQTKGSISQSLKVLEKDGFIERKPSQKDKRVTHLYLTDKGQTSLNRMTQHVMPNLEERSEEIDAIRFLLQTWQVNNNHKGFGQCQTCCFNRTLNNGEFECGLTNEPLSQSDIRKICREHAFAGSS
jgi:DNA-binding MarR family transcriptional regulator